MVSLALVSSKVAYGLGKAGAALGSSYKVQRPTGLVAPLGGAAVTTLLANFDSTPKFTLLSPSKVEQPLRYGLFDYSLVQEGDYLVGERTYFVAQLEAAQAPLCVKCDRVLSLIEPGGDVAAQGPRPYGGRTNASDKVVASGWPASVLLKTRGEAPPTRLPGDVRSAYFQILLPPSFTQSILPEWRLMDDLGTPYVVASSQLTTYGWQLLALVASA